MDLLHATHATSRARPLLRHSNDPFRFVHDHPMPAFLVQRTGICTHANAAGTHLLHRPLGDIIGQPISSWFDERTRLAVAVWLSRLSANPFARIVVGLNTGAGESRLVELTATKLGGDGYVVFFNPPLVGATLLERAVQQLKSAFLLLDPELVVIYANDAVENIHGYSASDLLGRDIGALFALDEYSSSHFENVFRALDERGQWSGRVTACRTNGETFLAELSMTALMDEVGVLLGYSATIRDLSLEIEREQQASRVAKLASAGTLLSGIAHEINNPLATLSNFLHLMLADADRGDDDRRMLSLMQREVERLTRIVANVRTMVRNDDDTRVIRSSIDLNEVIRHILKTQEYRHRTLNISVETHLADLPPVFADRSQIEQVLLNLVVNAQQAMDGQERERKICITTTRGPRGARIILDDTGPGVPEHLRDRIFDPFFTSKAPGEGVGLGLSLVQHIVAAHSGDVQVATAPSGGARFIVDLPLTWATGARDEDVKRASTKTSGAPLHILLVDDEDVLRTSVHAILSLDGHIVDEAANARQAIEQINRAFSSGNGYDVIVSDLRMPGLGGEHLLAALRERGDGLDKRVIFITGDNASSGATRLLSGAPVIYKPFKPEEILTVVRRIGDRNGDYCLAAP